MHTTELKGSEANQETRTFRMTRQHPPGSYRYSDGEQVTVTGEYTSSVEAYTEDGGATWRYVSNKAIIPLNIATYYEMPCQPEAQAEAYQKGLETLYHQMVTLRL